MDSLKERHKSYQQKRRFDGIMKLERSESRHNKNMLNVQKKLDERDEKNKEKIFKTYINFFFARRGREKELKLKNTKNDHKLQLKAEKIEELERDEEKKTQDLIKKLGNIEKRKKEILKHKHDQIILFNKKRKKFRDTAKAKKELLLKDLSESRFNIIDYQNELLRRSTDKEHLYSIKKILINERIINDQLNFEKNVKNFYKKLEYIKSENVLRLSVDDRRKIFTKLKKKEAEKKKKEEEEKLLNMM